MCNCASVCPCVLSVNVFEALWGLFFFLRAKVQRCADFMLSIAMCRMYVRKVYNMSELGRDTAGRPFRIALNIKGVLISIPFLLGCTSSGPPQRKKNIYYRIKPQSECSTTHFGQ